MKLSKQQKMSAMKAYNAYWDNYLKGDVEAMASLLSNKYTQVGSAETEVFFNKKDAVKFLYDTIDQVAGKLELRNRSIKLEKQTNFLLFHELCDLYALAENELIFYSKFRATTIMEEKKQGWKIIHQHSSFPDARTGEGENIAIDKLAEENRELREAVKRRTVEIEHKSRELEIEAALERVRTIAMGMRKPADMLDVCKMISLQLESLGVKEIRNVQTAIFYEQRGTYMNYEFYAKHDKTFITETVFTNNEIHNEFATKMLKGKGEVFITHINGEEVKGWIAYQKTTNVFIDKYLETASSLNYYWFSLGPVALGISTYQPLKEEEIDLFKRFLKVFELAYQRYLDIEQAETQAREAQIEASLERVRAVAMGMNKSHDLLSICEVSFKEFKKLGFDNIRNALIHIQYDEQKYFMDYDFSDLTGGAITKIEYGSHPVVEDYLKQIRSAKDAFYQGVIKEDQLEEWKNFRRNSGQIDDPRLDNATSLYYYFFSIGMGDIGISTLEPIDESQLKILKRFRNVFDLAYRRYNDITQAEAQVREAQIEASLERVRAHAMGLRSSDELSNIIAIIFEELKKLGLSLYECGICIRKGNTRDFTYWGSGSEDIRLPLSYHFPFFDHPILNNVLLALDEKLTYREFTAAGQELQEYGNLLFTLTDFKCAPKEYKESFLSLEKVFVGHAYMQHGFLEAVGNEPIPVEIADVLKRFTNVIDLTYTRFHDLQKAEAQAREAQIELALERVRARTMAMQKSDELKEVIRVVYTQFVHLKINVDHAGFVVDYTPKGDWHFWIADEQDIPSKITHPYFESVWANQFNEAKEKGADFFATNLNFEEKNKFYNELLSYVPGLPEASKDFYLSCPGLAATTVLFDNVSLYIENFSGTPYSDEENKILMRFGKVFQQTYTRFLDLQKAEAQAREANIETSLERVRSKAMAMHTTGDLSATVSAAFSELRKLGVETIRTGVALYSKDKPAPVFYASTTTEKDDALTIVGSPDPSSHACLALQFDAWSQQQNYFPVLRGEELKSYYLALSLQPFLLKDNSEPFQHDEYGYYLPFSGGNFYVWSLKSCTENEISILSRFRAIIDLTFRRYFEIQKAEAQAREAKIESSLERVRARAMSMHTPNDLSATVSLFFKELKSLNVLPWRCGVGRIDEETRTTYLTTTSITKDGDFTEVSGKLKQTGHPVLDGIFDHWKLQKEYYPVLRGDEINDYYSIIKPQIAYPDYPLDAVQYGHNIPFKEGFIFAWTENKLSEEELGIFRRFASVLSLTYRRYLDLKEAEERNRIIQAENDRKTKELEEARQLQLSLLPRTLPQLSQFDIAVYMKTATEVGGDYYDFNVQPNGVLNIGIGDATGHGLQAGTMITLMKGFFTADVAKFSPQKFLEHCNGIIRDIKLGRILMSFSHLRFENNSLLISSAGMPPVYYHHKKNNRTEEIIIQGLPLGAMGSASYKLVEKQLNSGDTILLLTDGLPEQMNSHKEIFDYSRVLKYFDEIAENAPNELINRFVQKAEDWMGGQKQSDDVTFVVIKVR